MAQLIGSIRRRLETVLEEFKRSRSTWNELNSDAFASVNTLVNSVIQSRYIDETAYWHPVLLQEFPNIVQQYDQKMSRVIDRHCQKVETFVQKMANQHRKMKHQVAELHALHQRLKDLGDDYANRPLYKTCPMVIFGINEQGIVEMFTKELATKQSMLKEDGWKQIKRREEGLVWISVWLNQPNIVDAVVHEFDDLCRAELDIE
ncbi:hypothetical protein DFQ29_001286 [Apophysomyces sp. BC1021]|nr:hypothetical protein DFQ29_001286 [Apophysomyces sp. BC1021]